MNEVLDIVPVAERDYDFRDVARLVADALDVGYKLERGGNLSEVVRYRLAAKQYFHALPLDVELVLVNLAVARRYGGCEFLVLCNKGGYRIGYHILGNAAHFYKFEFKAFQLFLERSSCCHTSSLLILYTIL